MYYDTTLQEAFSRGLKCHSNDLSKTGKFVRLIAKYLHEDYNSIFYGKSQNLGRVLCKAYDEALQKYDVLILPTIPKKAPVFPQENPPLEGQVLPFLQTIPCNCITYLQLDYSRPSSHDPFGQHQGSRPLAISNTEVTEVLVSLTHCQI